MSKRAVIYARVSTDEQSQNYSLPTQLAACRAYAEEHGDTIIETFQEDYTGTELSRPELDKLRILIYSHAVDVVIVLDLDRLARGLANQLIIEQEFKSASVQIEYVLGQYANTPEGELLKNVKAVIAEYENVQRVERSRRGKVGRVKAGQVLMPAGRAPFGYTYISEPHKGRLEINEAQAAVMRQMYHWLTIDRLSSYAIAKKLWEDGILSKGDFSNVVVKKTGRAEWSPATVRKMLSNPVYKGMWYYGKKRVQRLNGKTVTTWLPQSEWIAVPVPAIVDAETWELAQEYLQRNREQAKRNSKRDYLLRGFVFCRCRRRWTGIYKNHLNRAYYRCPSNEAERWRARCDMPGGVRQEILETAIWEKVKTELLHPDALQAGIAERRQAIQADLEHKVAQFEAIKRQLADVDRKMSILLDEILTSDFSQAVIDQKKRDLKKQRDDLAAKAKQLEQEMQTQTITPEQEVELLDFAARVQRGLNNFTFEEKRRTLELLDTRIDMLSQQQAKISGKLTPGLFVDILSA